MTLYGLDVADYQRGLRLDTAVEQGYTFAMAKVTEGTDWVASTYAQFRDDAEATGLMFAAYHFLRSDSDIGQQARWCVSHLGDKSIPIMVDVETEGNSAPSLTQIKAFVSAVHNAGGRVSLVYVPEWYWDSHMGRPSLVGLPAVVSSKYVSGTGFASALYPGDGSSLWGPYGNVNPTILQFSSNAKYSGYTGTIDVDAFRGTVDQLRSLNLFKEWDMPLSQDDINKVAEAVVLAIYGDIRRGPKFPNPPGQSGNNKELRTIVREEVQALLPPKTA